MMFISTLDNGLCPGPAVLDNLWGNHSQRQDNQGGDNDNIIEVSDNRNKVRDDIEGQKGIAYGCRQQPPGWPGRSVIFQDQLICSDFTL